MLWMSPHSWPQSEPVGEILGRGMTPNRITSPTSASTAALLALLVIQYHWSYWPAVVVAVLAGGLFAGAVEATVITRLFRARNRLRVIYGLAAVEDAE